MKKGRPTENTKKEIKRLKDLVIQEIQEHNNIIVATQKIDISYQTFWRWYNKDKEFSKRVDEARKTGLKKTIEFAEGKLMEQIKSGNLTAIIFFLCNKGDWKSVNKVENNNRIEVPKIVLKMADYPEDDKNEK